MTPDEYCEDKARQSGSSFYYSFIFLDDEQRQAMVALYAFCREVDDVVDECLEFAVAETKLEWWRQEVKRLFAGEPQHPVTKALQTAIERYNLAEEYFNEIIDGMEMDLNYNRYGTFKDLSLYCYRVASCVGLLSIEIFGYQHRDTHKYAKDLGIALQLTNILRDVREDATRGRIYIPEDELARFSVTPEMLLEGIENDNTRALFKFQAERALEYYEKAFANLPASDRYTQRSGIIMADIYRATLMKLIEMDYPVLKQRVSLSKLKKLWIAWRSARREAKQHHQLLKSNA